MFKNAVRNSSSIRKEWLRPSGRLVDHQLEVHGALAERVVATVVDVLGPGTTFHVDEHVGGGSLHPDGDDWAEVAFLVQVGEVVAGDAHGRVHADLADVLLVG